MTLPRFSAEMSLYKTQKFFESRSLHVSDSAMIVPQQPIGDLQGCFCGPLPVDWPFPFDVKTRCNEWRLQGTLSGKWRGGLCYSFGEWPGVPSHFPCHPSCVALLTNP